MTNEDGAIGNPLYWTDGRALTWENVESLASITDGTNTTTYTYNGNGLRTYKSTVGGKTTEYYILDGTYVGEKTTVNGNTYIISYVYDENGAPAGLNINGSAYYFVKNIQGDILAIMSYSGTVMARYYYDAWGNIVYVIDANGNKITNEENVAILNPFRYRGYMYDQETGFYYLRSRYYDPEVGRFLNADNVVGGIDGNLNGYNLFSYCFNNPVIYVDFDGAWPDANLLFKGALAFAIGTLTVAAVVATGGACTPLVALGYSALATAGTVMMATGASEIEESFTGENKIKDKLGQDGFDTLQAGATFVISFGTDIISMGNNSVCFVAGTLVASEDGNIPIEEIAVGMLVYATDPETGETALKQVVQTFENETTELLHLTVNNEEIVTTPSHPFWVPQKGWIEAAKLRAGDMLQLLNGEYVVLEAVQHEVLESPITVYNFEVEDFHTYYVADSGILVHNSCVDYNYDGAKNQRYVNRRGWTDDMIAEAISNGPKGTSINMANNATCTVYCYPGKSNQYVVIDDITNSIVQVSRFFDDDWIPDSRIKWK